MPFLSEKLSTIEHNYVKINGIRLHYVTSGEGELILFLHGFPEFWYEWKNQLSEFNKDFFVVAPDMRGYNLSTKPEDVDQYQIQFLVEDIRALIEHLGGKKVILVGHDWGGVVAWCFAIAYPNYLEKLVIINAPHPAIFPRELTSNPLQMKASEYMALFQSSQAEQILSDNNYDALLNRVMSEVAQKGIFTQEDNKAYIKAWSQPGALTGGLNYYRAPQPTINDSNPLTVQVPTLVIWGEKDTALLPGNLKGLDQYVPNLTIERIPDGSHWVVHEKPEMVNDYIRKFIS